MGAAAAAVSPAALAEEKPTVLMVGFQGWPECLLWRRQVEPAWKATPQFSRVTFREWEAYNYRLIGRESEWPADLRYVYREFLLHQAELEPVGTKKVGGNLILYSPRFYALQGGKILMTAGSSNWDSKMIPFLSQLVGA
jgi:hypothetical protein